MASGENQGERQRVDSVSWEDLPTAGIYSAAIHDVKRASLALRRWLNLSVQ